VISIKWAFALCSYSRAKARRLMRDADALRTETQKGRQTLKKTICVTALAALCIARPTSAAPITWLFTGQVTGAFDNSGGEGFMPPVGSNASLAITWESNTSRGNCLPGSGLYDAIIDATLYAGGKTAKYGGGAIEVNAPEGNCHPSYGTGVEFHMFGQPFGQPTPPWLLNEILAHVGPVDVNAPNLAGILAGVTGGYISVQSTFGAGSFQFSGPMQVVPEPSSMVLLGTGLLAAARKVARRRRRGD
jgi:hypothetical protein